MKIGDFEFNFVPVRQWPKFFREYGFFTWVRGCAVSFMHVGPFEVCKWH